MNKRILFVDGDPTVAVATTDMLEQMGHRVQLEISGTDAFLAPPKETPGDSTSLLPPGMHDISGFLPVQKILKIRPDMPVILLASQEGKTQSIARESGISWFAIKPLSLTGSSTVDAVMNE